MAAPSQADPAAAGNDGQKKVPLVTKEQVDSAYDNKDTEYEVVRELAPEIQLVRRRDDGAEFLGFPWDIEQTAPKLHALINRGAGQAVEALLCHPNLVSYCTAAPFHLLRGARRVRRLLSLWDYCGAGTLEALLTKSQLPVRSCPRTGNIQGWLPESICWHVALSLLSALAWLHEGHYEEEVAEWQGETGWGTPTKVTKTYTAEFREGEDWMPILHRYIVPGNIYFQDPKGIETYGMCKLGNYSRVFVSGHVNQWSGGHVVCSQDGRAPLAHVMQNMALDNIYSIEKVRRARSGQVVQQADGGAGGEAIYEGHRAVQGRGDPVPDDDAADTAAQRGVQHGRVRGAALDGEQRHAVPHHAGPRRVQAGGQDAAAGALLHAAAGGAPGTPGRVLARRRGCP